MARLNVYKTIPPVYTHEGAKASHHISALLQLRRTVMACMLWEDTFYEDGQSVADRIKSLIPSIKPTDVAQLAIDARTKMKLRHVPLLIAREMARLDSHKGLVSDLLFNIIQRPDELTEFLAIYWKEGKQPLANSVKRGLARAFTKFNEYELAKYNRDAAVKLRDVLFLSHSKPADATRTGKYTKDERKNGIIPTYMSPGEVLYSKVAKNALVTPDTWEVALSAGADKAATFIRLMSEKRLGALACLRNLRNMRDAGVDKSMVADYLCACNLERVLPFRFIAAARMVPQWEDILEQPMVRCLESQEKLHGNTALFVDVSGSMDHHISQKSDITRLDAACGLAILLREICSSVDIYTFSNRVVAVPARRGFALRDAVVKSQSHQGTLLGQALSTVYARAEGRLDRTIVITDEQSRDQIPNPKGEGYIINVASYEHGIGYDTWTKIDGWSEAVVDYITTLEQSGIKLQ